MGCFYILKRIINDYRSDNVCMCVNVRIDYIYVHIFILTFFFKDYNICINIRICMYLYLHCVLKVIFYLILYLNNIYTLRSKAKSMKYVQNSIF